MAQQQLPDFTQAGRHFAQASDELEQRFQRMNNLPPVTLAQITNQSDLIRQSSDLIRKSIRESPDLIQAGFRLLVSTSYF